MTTIQAIPFAPDRFSEYGYSPALGVGDLLFVAGQSSINDDGDTVGAGDFEAQGHQTFPTSLACSPPAAARSQTSSRSRCL
jgi:enamine deaminase RidA (YjgF/YER057c/UK114 family)